MKGEGMEGICIFCMENKALTEEHVVPDCVGGGLTADILCKSCNEMAGSKIDGPFVNTLFVQLPRLVYQIPGKTGYIPNPFGTVAEIANSGTSKAKLTNQFEPYLIPEVKTTDEGEGLRLTVSVDKKDEKNLEKILQKKLERSIKDKWPDMQEAEAKEFLERSLRETMAAATTRSSRPELKYTFEIDLDNIPLEYVKIAYEMAYLKHGMEYINKSPVAQILKSAIVTCDKKAPIHGSVPLPQDMFKEFFSDPEKHYVLLFKNTCYIKLFQIAGLVKVCEESEQFSLSEQNSILYIFDSITRRHEVVSFIDFLGRTLEQKR
jgi:hypothetical protein